MKQHRLWVHIKTVSKRWISSKSSTPTKMKNLKLEGETAKRLYKTADAEFKTMLEESFGKEFFTPKKITDKIKTFDDVLIALGVSDSVLPFRNPRTKAERAANAFMKIGMISEVLNEGWKADFTDKNTYKYYPYFERKMSGWSVLCSAALCVSAYVGFGFFFKSSELALYAGNQFLDIYKDYLPE
jgi:hypothetical protein